MAIFSPNSSPPILKKKVFSGVTVATLLIIAIMILAFTLHMVNIQSIGDANAYYTAAVKSMLTSWKNFFFVAAEPGGSVTVDKPPLGLWIEAIFAYFLGVSGFSVSLPNILAGVLGIPLLYGLVKKHMGELAGLIAAFVMAITPVFVATNRNNTMDGMLVFTLLLAAWAFIRATETGKLRWLLLGAFIVGLGFNIKMMQAFLPLPAFYALYFLAGKQSWLRKLGYLAIATVLLVVVSLSWAVAVDLVPAEQRPYIGSSEDNTVMGLIFGHNGLSRLENLRLAARGQNDQQQPSVNPNPGANIQPNSNTNTGVQPQQGTNPGGPPPAAFQACAIATIGSSCSFTLQNGNTINGSCIQAPNPSRLVCAPVQNAVPNGAEQAANGQQMPPGQRFSPDGQSTGTPFSQETGSPGILRFFTQPLSKQISWLLPFALISILLVLFASRLKFPLESSVHKALILWGGWLLTCVVFFSIVSGIFHAYYAIMLAPPLGAMVGIGFAQLWSWEKGKKWAGAVLAVSVAITLAFQLFALSQYGESPWWAFAGLILLFLAVILYFVKKQLAYMAALAAITLVPFYWTVMTVTSNANINLPSAYSGTTQQSAPATVNRNNPQAGGQAQIENQRLIDFLAANTNDVEYLVAVPSSQQGAVYVIATGRPVLYMGGFSGQDDVVSADNLAQMVADGELRYVLYGGQNNVKVDIMNWLQQSCNVVQDFSRQNLPNQQITAAQGLTLYECK